MEIVNISYNGSGFEYQDYSVKDDGLVLTNFIYSSFGENSDVIEYHIYDENGLLLTTEYSAIVYYPDRVNAQSDLYSSIELDPREDLKSKGYNRGTLNIQYNFLRNLFNSSTNSKYWIKDISTSRTELRLSSQTISDGFILDGFNNYQEYIQNKNYYPDFYLNFGNNNLIICTNVAYTEDDNGSYLLIKLYEPLPIDFDVKSQLWIVDKISESSSYIVDIQIEATQISTQNQLRGPNYKISLDKKVGQSTPYYNYSSLYSSSYSGGTQKLLSYYDDKALSINVDFSDFSNFIRFSSAEERLYNFREKLIAIEDYTQQIAEQSALGATNIVALLQGYLDNIIEKFDIYEYDLYYTSASWAWPKSTSTQPYTLSPVASIEAENWYATASYSASYYDELNSNQLINTIPQYILDDCDNDTGNEPYIRFMKMIGQHFDNIWVYYKDVTNRFDATNNPQTGISNDIVADALQGLGFTLYTNTNVSDNLYYSLFGINQDGTLLPPVGNEIINTYVTSSIPTISANDLQKEIYRRLYHNLPYLLKTKGTRRGIQALINCFGIPEEILTVNEFGGYNRYSQIGVFELNNNKITIPEVLSLSSSLLSAYSTNQYYSTNNRLNTTELEVGFSPSDKINENINQFYGYFNIDSYIGEPSMPYSTNYLYLEGIYDLYFSSYTFPHSLYEYIRLIKYYNNSVFKTIKDFVPARADLSTGLIIKPNVLQRSKYARHEPSSSLHMISQSIDMIDIIGDPGNVISGSTQYSGFTPSTLGYIQFTSSQGEEKVTGEFGGTVLEATNGLSMSQSDVSNITGSLPIYVNYGATHQNVSMSIRSHRFFDVDYSSNQTIPVNYGLITQSIANSQINYMATYNNPYAPYAYLQDYNYDTKAWTISRYSGSRLESKLYSTYSVGDISYGKTAAIDKLKYQYAYLVDIYTSSLFFPERANSQIKYIIDNNQNVLDLTKTNENIFEVQNIFKSGETADVSLFEYDELNPYTQKLVNNPTLRIFEGGYRYLPILHNVSGSNITQSFDLETPIKISIQSPQYQGSPGVDKNNWTVDWEIVEDQLEACVGIPPSGGTSNYAINLIARYNVSPPPGNPFRVVITVLTDMQFDGSCGNIKPLTIVVLTGAGTGRVKVAEITGSQASCLGDGTGIGGPDSNFRWPANINVCTPPSIDSIAQFAPPPPGQSVFVSDTYISTITGSDPCLYYLSESAEIVFPKEVGTYYTEKPIYNSYSDTHFESGGLDRVILPFTLGIGDRISLYDSSSLGWSEKSEYTIYSTRLVTSSFESGSKLVARITPSSSVNAAILSSGSLIPTESFTGAKNRICRYVVWKRLPDETNVILRYNPKSPTLIENGLLLPQYIDQTVRKESGNTVKALKQQNLI